MDKELKKCKAFKVSKGVDYKIKSLKIVDKKINQLLSIREHINQTDSYYTGSIQQYMNSFHSLLR